MSIIVDQNSAGNIDAPSAGSSTIFVDQSGQLAVKQANGTSGSIPTVSSSNTQVIYNDQGNLAGNSSLTYNSSTTVLSAPFFSGNGAALSSIAGANVSGAVSYATTANSVAGANVSGAVSYATTANSVAGANVSGAVSYATTANSVAGANVSGIVSLAATASYAVSSGSASTAGSATTAGTVTASAQPNITSLGTITLLSVGGNLDVSGNINVTGNLNYSNVNDLVVSDPLIYLGANNTGDLVDIGLVGSYNEGIYYHTGIARNHTDNAWTFFDGVVAEPTTVIDWANATYPNVKAGYFIGNGSQLTGLSTSSISNGTSNVIVTSSANVNISSAGTANVVAVSNNGVTVSGTLVATGQTSLGGAAGAEGLRVNSVSSSVNYWLAQGSTTNGGVQFRPSGGDTNIPALFSSKGGSQQSFYTNTFGQEQFRVSHTANAVNYVQVTGGVTGAPGSVYISAQGTDANVSLNMVPKGTAGTVALMDNSQSTTLRVIAKSSTGDTFLDVKRNTGYVELISNSTNANADIVFTPKGSGNVSTTANVIGGNLRTGGLITATGNITGGNLVTAGVLSVTGNANIGNIGTAIITATGNITGANLVTAGLVTATGNVRGANLVTPGIVSATGNVSASYFIGNGSLLTGLSGSSLTNGNSNLIVNANANVTISSAGTANVVIITNTGANVAGTISASGNITAGNFIATGSSGNITGANVIFANSIIATGTAGLGYGTGAGSTVTQSTSKSTTVTLNNPTGQITMNNAALAANTTVAFTCNNSTVAATDIVVVNITASSPSAQSAYNIWAYVGTGAISFNLKNISGSSYSDALIVNFAVIKGVTS